MMKESISAVLPKKEISEKAAGFSARVSLRKSAEKPTDGDSKPIENREKESATEEERTKEIILNGLKKEGILEKIDNYNVFDLDKFLNDFIMKKLENKALGRIYITRPKIFESLADMKVVSKNDFSEKIKSNKEIEEIPLFNIPESVDDAFDLEKVGNKKYYLNYWDLYGHSKKRRPNWSYNIRAKNGEEIDARELALAIKIFRDFEGRREKDGNLTVFDKKARERQKISAEWGKDNIGTFGDSAKKDSMSSPHNFLLKYCPNLLKGGLIKLEDFNIKTIGGLSGELLRKEWKVNETDPYVFIKGIKYYIGQNYFIYKGDKIPTKNLKISILDNKTAGVLKSFKSKDELVYILNLLSEEERENKTKEVEDNYKSNRARKLKPKELSGRVYILKKEVDKRISPWAVTEDCPQRNDESPKEYAERIRRVSDWNFIKQVSDDFTRECQIGIHNLTWREQEWLSSAAYELGKNYPRLLEFGKRYGLAGLKTFLSCEQDIKNAKEILNLGENLNGSPEATDRLFVEYAGMVDGAGKSAEEVCELYNEIFYEKQLDKKEVNQAILKRASELLLEAGVKLKDRNLNEKNKEDVVFKLIEELNKEKETQEGVLREFRQLALKLNSLYGNIIYTKSFRKAWKVLIGNDIDNLDNEIIDSLEDDKDEEILKVVKELDSKMRKGGGLVNEWREKLKNKDFKKNLATQIKQEQKKEKRFDSEKIQSLLKRLKKDGPFLMNINIKDRDFHQTVKGVIKDRSKFNEESAKEHNQLVLKLEQLLQYQKNLEKKLDQIVMGNFHPETDNKLLERYNEIKQTAENLSEYIYNNFKTLRDYLSPEEIADELLKESADIISSPTASEEEWEKALEKLEKTSANLLLLEKIFKQLPREEIAELDLKKMPVIERLENIKSADLLQKEDLTAAMKKVIDGQFPAGDGEVFLKECAENKNLRFTVTLADGKVLSFFAKENVSENIEYVDWFISNPDAPVKGLGEATIKLGFDDEDEKKQSYYAVAKPHAKAFSILVEKLGFVALKGSTEDGEYKHHYARVRRFPGDAKFKTKHISPEASESFKKDLSYICAEPNDPQTLVYEGKILSACKIVYHGQTYRDDIRKDEQDGWIFKEIEKQYQKGFVLTRFIPESAGEKNQTFYAVFEQDVDSNNGEFKPELKNVIERRKKQAIPIPPQKKRAEAG